MVAIVLLTGCDRRVATCDHRSEVSELRELKLPRAESDAISAYKSGDRRLLAVYGFALEVPGYRGDFYAHPEMVRALAGTGDAYCDDEERQLNVNARAYAKRYNEVMLKLTGSASTAN
ncbi:MAG TPA: hypothetical protein VFH59_08005 [Frateuria sp.]|uniref:hypothetical protein n=1 Tax=Frateuria sp. TaxID=2211372 RepID=UPI002D7E8BC6|nr:hypothetical protein [Frateuria sp.]HET6805366.1 hypothetical protein [Frateuria sp.]